MLDYNAILAKPFWLRPPCWRWNIILAFQADPSLDPLLVQQDDYLYEGILYYRSKKISVNLGSTAYISKYPELAYVHDIFNCGRYGSWRWIIEALITAGLDNRAIVTLLNVPITEQAIQIYRKLFFDVEDYLHSGPAVESNILSTSRLSMQGRLDCDYTWKLFGYIWGGPAFIDNFMSKRMSPDAKVLKWFKDLARERLTINAFQASSELRYSYNIEGLEILKTAKEYWAITEDDMQQGEDLAANSFISSMASHIDMCLLRAADKSATATEDRLGYQFVFSGTPTK